jgi:hypothetical protein
MALDCEIDSMGKFRMECTVLALGFDLKTCSLELSSSLHDPISQPLMALAARVVIDHVFRQTL